MQLSTLLSVILACIVAVAALKLVPEEGEQLPSVLETARDDVNKQLIKMRQMVVDAEKGDDTAKALVKMAFGDRTPRQLILDGIDKFTSEEIRISKEIPKGTNGATSWKSYRLLESDALQYYEFVKFGDRFYSKDANAGLRAATLLHEAAHAILGAGDNYLKVYWEIMPGGVELPDIYKDLVVKGGGYFFNPVIAIEPGIPITEEMLSQGFKDLREKSDKMNMNADSWALLGQLCDIHMPGRRKRALLEDDPVTYLAKRAAAYKPKGTRPNASKPGLPGWKAKGQTSRRTINSSKSVLMQSMPKSLKKGKPPPSITPPPVSRGNQREQTSKRVSKPRNSNASNAARPKTSAQKATKAPAAPNVAKARSKPVVGPLKSSHLRRRRVGKPE